MVEVTETEKKIKFKIIGFHQIWALQSEIIVDKENIVNAYQDQAELKKWKGFRIGTYIPYLITAGTFSWKGQRNFWDVSNKRNTIIVTLRNHTYTKLYIEVKNPSETIKMLT